MASVQIVVADELDQTVRLFEQYKSNYDQLRNDMNQSATDQRFNDIARERNNNAFDNYRYYKTELEAGNNKEALKYAQQALYNQFSAVFALHLSRVTYFQTLCEKQLEEYERSDLPHAYFEIKYNESQLTYERTLNVWRYNLDEYSEEVNKLRDYVDSMAEDITSLYSVYGEFEDLSKEMNADLEQQEIKKRNRTIFLFIIGLACLIIGGSIVYLFTQRKHIVNRSFNYNDILEDEDIKLENGIRKRLDDLLRTINLGIPSVSIFLIGASLETTLSYLYRDIEKKDVPEQMTLGNLVDYTEKHLQLSTNIKKAMHNMLEDRNSAVHDADYEFEEEDVKQNFSRLKKVIKAVLKAKRVT